MWWILCLGGTFLVAVSCVNIQDAPNTDYFYRTSYYNSAVTGYPRISPSNPFTYPTSTTPKSPITGYPRVTPSQTFTYPSYTTRTTPKPLITGYPKVTPSKTFNYPSSTTTRTTPKPLITGYPKVTTSQTYTYPSYTTRTTPKPLITGYPKVTPSQTFNYPTSTTRTTPKPLITGYPKVTTSQTYTYPSSTTRTTPKPLITGYPKVTPSQTFTYPPYTTRTTPKPLITGYPKVTTSQTYTYPSSTTRTTPKPLITGYPKVTPSQTFTYPPSTTRTTPKPLITGYPKVTTSQTYTYPSSTTRTTPKPLITGYPKVTTSKTFNYPSSTTRTTPKPLITGYPKVTTSQTYTYPSSTTRTTPKPLITGYPKVTPSKTFNYPSSTTRTTPKPLITGYPKVTTGQTYTYPSSTTRTTPKPLITGYPKVTPSKTFNYPSSTTRTTPKPLITGYPKVTPSQSFTYPSSTTRTTPKPLITGYPKVTPSQSFTYPSSTTRTTPKPLITGYPKVTPSQTFSYLSPIRTTPKPFVTEYQKVTTIQTYPSTITTPKPLITGYHKVTPSQIYTYPSPTTRTTPKPLITGYPSVTPSKSFTYPPTTHKTLITGYPKEAPRNPFTYPTSQRPTLPGYLHASPNNPVIFLSPVEQFYLKDEGYLQSSIAKRRVYRSPAGEDNVDIEVPQVVTQLVDHTQINDGHHHDDGHYNPYEDHSHWDIRKSVPGEPGKDYPVFDTIPKTSFSCIDKSEGYYADGETGCQVFHVCSATPGKIKSSFLCPNGSIFNQRLFTCDWWNNVDCTASESLYMLNVVRLTESQKSTSDELILGLTGSRKVDSVPKQNLSKHVVTPGRGNEGLHNVLGFNEFRKTITDTKMALTLNGSGDINITPMYNMFNNVVPDKDVNIDLSQEIPQQNSNNTIANIKNIYTLLETTDLGVTQVLNESRNVDLTPKQNSLKNINTYLPPITPKTHYSSSIILPSSLLPPLEAYSPTTILTQTEGTFKDESVIPKSGFKESVSSISIHNDRHTDVTYGDISLTSHEFFPSQVSYNLPNRPLPTMKLEEISTLPSLPATTSTIYEEESFTLRGQPIIPSTIQNEYIPPNENILRADAPLINSSNFQDEYFNSQEVSIAGYPLYNPSTIQNEYIPPEISTHDTPIINNEYVPSTVNNEYLAPHVQYTQDGSIYFETTSDKQVSSQAGISSQSAYSSPVPIYPSLNYAPQVHLKVESKNKLINEYNVLQTPESFASEINNSSEEVELHKSPQVEFDHAIQFINDRLNEEVNVNPLLDERFLRDDEPETLIQTSVKGNLHQRVLSSTQNSKIQTKEDNGPSQLHTKFQGDNNQSQILGQLEEQQVLSDNSGTRELHTDVKPINVAVENGQFHTTAPDQDVSSIHPSILTTDNYSQYNVHTLGNTKTISPVITHVQQQLLQSTGDTTTQKIGVYEHFPSTTAHSFVESNDQTSVIFNSPIEEAYQYNSLPLSQYQSGTSSHNNNIRIEGEEQSPLAPHRRYNFQQEIPFTHSYNIGVQPPTHQVPSSVFGVSHEILSLKPEGPELIQSVSFNFDTLDGQQEFASAVAAGILGDRPAQPHLKDFSQQNGYVNYIPSNPLTYNSPTRQQHYK